MIETVSNIFNTLESHVDSMPAKGRIQLKELTQLVATSLKLDPKDILGFVTYFARNTDVGYVSRGKNGGFIKGVRPAKTPVATVTAATAESEDESTEDSDDDSSEE